MPNRRDHVRDAVRHDGDQEPERSADGHSACSVHDYPIGSWVWLLEWECKFRQRENPLAEHICNGRPPAAAG